MCFNVLFENLLLSDEVCVVIFNMIDSLFEDLKIVIIFCEIEGMSYEEIVVVMDCFVGMVCLCIFCVCEVIDNKLNLLIGEF